jgi:hypothetical protein
VIIARGDGGPGCRPDLGGGGLVSGGPVAKLAVVIAAPGPEGAVRLETDRVLETGSDGGPVGRPGRFLGGGVPFGGGPVTERAIVIVAPGPQGAVRFDG